MTLRWPTKDPDASLDYAIDWTDWLKNDTITSSTWVLPNGITKVRDSFTDTVATIWLSGGADGSSYSLLNKIETAGGRKEDRSVLLELKQK
jgi:hypothetical protein